ncbi:MAG: molybdate ABC transporter substrate-binding protein [Raoultibacter sp.]
MRDSSHSRCFSFGIDKGEFMKKALVFFVSMMMVVGVMAGCSASQPEAKPAEQAPATEQKAATNLEGHTLQIYCGAGMTKPFQEIADAFKAETSCEMNTTFANAGQIQSQINTTKEGDLFIAGAKEETQAIEGVIASSTDLVKHIPVLVAGKDNPKNITGLADLANEGVTFIMGDPESTPIGKIAKKSLGDLGIFGKINVIATTTTAPQLATAIGAGEADASIVWKENSKADGVQIVQTTDLDKYVKTIPAVSLTCSKDAEALTAFSEYLGSDAAHAIWEKYGYEVL